MVLYQNFIRGMENYSVFEGRASRSEFWWFLLATIIVGFFVGLVSIPLASIPVAFYFVIGAFALAMFTPTLAVIVRRLHDTGRSAWWALGFVLSVIYDLGALLGLPGFSTVLYSFGIAIRIYTILLVVFMALPSNSGDNRYGSDPNHIAGGAR